MSISSNPLFVEDWDIGGPQMTDKNHFKYEVQIEWAWRAEYMIWCEENCTERFYRFAKKNLHKFNFYMAFESVGDAVRFKLIFG